MQVQPHPDRVLCGTRNERGVAVRGEASLLLPPPLAVLRVRT